MWQMFWLIASLTALSFGGGNTTIGALERVLVQSGRMDATAFAFSIALGQSTPGPLAAYTTALGMTLNGFPGALGATLGMLMVSLAAVMLILSIPSGWFQHPLFRSGLAGVAPFVAGVALFLGGRILAGNGTPPLVGVAVAVLVALGRRRRVPAALLVAASAALGMWWGP